MKKYKTSDNSIFFVVLLLSSICFQFPLSLLSRPGVASDLNAEHTQNSLNIEHYENFGSDIYDQLGGEYVLGAGDKIQVDIFNYPELSGQNGVYTVLVDGHLSIPLIGSVAVEGLSISEVEEVIAERYLAILVKSPILTVTLLAPRPVRVVLAGEVNRPGAYTVNLGETDSAMEWPTLTQLIRDAGGITQQANVRDIEIRRIQGQGETMTFNSNLWSLIRDGELEQDVVLRDGDRIVIPSAVNSPNESIEIASANFSPASINVQVVGEVPRTGSISLPPNANLNQAILAAGGLSNSRAQKSSVELIRLNPNGTVDRKAYEVDLSAPPNDQNNPILRPDDVVIVNRNTLAQGSDFLRLLLSPINSLAAIFRIFGLEL